jgi:Ca2+-binding RTX toxin-like protein
MATINGTVFDDYLDAQKGVTNNADSIFANDGNDTVQGLGGGDHIYGQDGDDHLYGNEGDDALYGGPDNDWLYGHSGADHLNGGSGINWAMYVISPAGVFVTLETGNGYYGHAAGDTLVNIQNVSGSVHGDTLIGNNGSNELTGREGDDVIKGGGGADTLRGNEDNDLLEGGAGADDLHGGYGSDTAQYGGSTAGVTVSLLSNAGSGGDAQGDHFFEIENIRGSGYADELWGNHSANVLEGQTGNDTLKGFGGADTLWGSEGHDHLWGMDGNNDTLHGENGDDYLNGGAGLDAMIGGQGNDTYVVDHVSDTVTELVNEGDDVVLTSTHFNLPDAAYIETLRTTDDDGVTTITLIGNSQNNDIIGNDGVNVIDGEGGADDMAGHGGDDIYYVDNANDTVSEAGGDGVDQVITSVSWTIPAGADVETLRCVNELSAAALVLTGNSSGTVIRGNSGANVINGGAGNDELIGLGGYDTFVFNTMLDPVNNVDLLSDFNFTEDMIHLENAVFGSLAPGGLAASQFVVGAAAQDGNDYIIYNDSTGALLYDSDGNDVMAAVRFAQLDVGTNISNVDFLIV